MPELAVGRLTFGKITGFYESLLSAPSHGALEQYVIGSLMTALVEQNGPPSARVETKQVNISDRSSHSAGDVQIVIGATVLEAFEVTTSPWRTKLGDAGLKLREHDLPRIHIVAPVAASEHGILAQELAELPDDVSVLDLRALVTVVTGALRKQFRARALTRLYEFLDRFEGAPRVNAFVELVKQQGLDHNSH